MNRKEDKIQEIEKFLEELESVLPSNFKEYEIDFKIRAICEKICFRIGNKRIGERCRRIC